MAGYFETLIDSYTTAPEPAFLAPRVELPAEDALAPGLPESQTSDAPAVDTGPTPSPLSEAEPPVIFAPVQDGADEILPEADVNTMPLTERIVDHVSERVEPAPEPTLPRTEHAVPEDPPPRPPDIIHEEHKLFEETHFHQDAPLVAEAPQSEVGDPAPEVPESPEDFEPEPNVASFPPPLDLADIERGLAEAMARLQGIEALPQDAEIAPQDFEPDTTPDIALPDPEPVREVTREVVREVHHHTETRIEAPPPPAPRSAAEASRIGPIRFASDWKTGGAR